jgi:hypothetical protein
LWRFAAAVDHVLGGFAESGFQESLRNLLIEDLRQGQGI